MSTGVEILDSRNTELARLLQARLGRPPKICLLSYSLIPDDPRVRRQGDAFLAAGWDVEAVSLPGWNSPQTAWPVRSWDDISDETAPPRAPAEADAAVAPPEPVLPSPADPAPPGAKPEPEPEPESGIAGPAAPIHRTGLKALWHSPPPASLRNSLRPALAGARVQLRSIIILAFKFIYFCKSLVHFGKRLIRSGRDFLVRNYYRVKYRVRYRLELGYQKLEPWLDAARVTADNRLGPATYFKVREIARFYRAAEPVKADLYLANDWHMLPIALKLADKHDAEICYDTHEYSLEEYRYRLYWRLTKRPLVRAIESTGLARALVSSAVSEGIADDMTREYRLARPMIAIRNMPVRSSHKSGTTGDHIDALYHGIIAPDRGLEECIRSVALWRPEFRLILRGPGSPQIMEQLRGIAREAGVEDRVVFAPPVPMLDLVKEAATADIGLSTPPKTSKHNIYAMPNKLFEYIQAGLAICVCDLPDMARLVRNHDLGILIDEVTPESIAAAINRFDRDSLDRFKANTRKASQGLCWEHESLVLTESYGSALLQALDARAKRHGPGDRANVAAAHAPARLGGSAGVG
ncbi:glycosyltransferase [Bosea sp. FBZP-16]|uniref:glycosyltransferase n=1 Tax=Bosea sp. FBZP-16 TaxID=2065382 RepID=UPI001319E1E8|nr:glycosyltransferase [Bosea sp. FBZP-16]